MILVSEGGYHGLQQWSILNVHLTVPMDEFLSLINYVRLLPYEELYLVTTNIYLVL